MTRWVVWRDGIQHGEPEPWAAETYGIPDDAEEHLRIWFATWREAYDFARKAINEEARG